MTLFVLLSLAVAIGNVWLAIKLWYLVARKRKELREAEQTKVKLDGELEDAKLYNRVLARRVIDYPELED